MFELIKRKLSLKVSLTLALITIPPMILAAYFITASESASVEELTISNGKLAAMAGAKMYGEALEIGIDTGVLTMGDLFDPVYEEIKGFEWGENPRFHTKFDGYTDRTVLDFQDKLLASSSDFIYALGNDMNGYLPTHNSISINPLTGDRAKDLTGNRTKRKFDNAMHIAARRNVEPLLVQRYVRDAGDPVWDVSSPIFVKGRHWGVFRMGVSRISIAAHNRALLFELSAVFGFLTLVTVGFIFLMMRRSMKPLELLATTASEISTGEGLDKPIKPASTDEIGQMAKSLNRLRASLQAAMGRLGE